MNSRNLQVKRSRGAVNGTLLVVLGAWAALIGQVGPYVDFGYTPDQTWNFSNGQLLYQVLPGAAVVLGGLILIGVADRVSGTIGGWVAAAGGGWLILGPVLNRLWDADGSLLGTPLGEDGASGVQPVAEQLAFYTGVGAVILFLAATAAGRYSVPEPVARGQAGATTEPVTGPSGDPIDGPTRPLARTDTSTADPGTSGGAPGTGPGDPVSGSPRY